MKHGNKVLDLSLQPISSKQIGAAASPKLIKKSHTSNPPKLFK